MFTSNQPRHLSLINKLSEISEQVYTIIGCNTVFPGKIEDFFKKSPVIQAYFKKVLEAEKKVFGNIQFLPKNVSPLVLKSKDINLLNMKILEPAFEADFYLVFGSAYLKGNLCKRLIAKRTINIHMGVSPYYRGSSTNFWALYDERPEMVGATIHLLSKGLDSGDILYHAFPKAIKADPFTYGMLAVRAAQESLIKKIKTGEIKKMRPTKQDKTKEIRYTRNKDFTDKVVSEYLKNLPTKEDIFNSTVKRNMSLFINPHLI